jgi:hypothetical protein
MAVSPNTLSGVDLNVDRFRVSDSVVLETLGRQSKSDVLSEGLVREIRETEARVDRVLLEKGIGSSDYFVVQLRGVLQMCAAITVGRVYRELGWGRVDYFGLPEYGPCILLAKEGADVSSNNFELIEKATRDGVLLTLGQSTDSK